MEKKIVSPKAILENIKYGTKLNWELECIGVFVPFDSKYIYGLMQAAD